MEEERRKLPALVEASAWAMLRAMAARRAMPCSAAAIVLAVGAFTTRQPNSVAACRSTLSMPTPALPTTFNLPFPASKTSLVTLVPLLTIKASQHEILVQSSSCESSYAHSTWPTLRNTLSPASPSFSETKIVGFSPKNPTSSDFELPTEVAVGSTVFKTLLTAKERLEELAWESFR